MKLVCAISLGITAGSTAAFAELPTGERTITLLSATEKIAIGTVTFTGSGDKRSLVIHMNEAQYKDQFLSMRPFKCLEGTARLYCHLPYPYPWKGEVTGNDLADLEYALLFVQKPPTAYGINLWNGIYYKLTLEPDGRITGKLNEVDMDILASPPPMGEMRPLNYDQINAVSADGQWLPQLTIE
jgi:hypothetical protein